LDAFRRDQRAAGELDHGRRYSNFFVAVSREWLVRFLKLRVDKRIIRLIQKWLKAGILEDGVVIVDDRGTGQGSAISPLLAACITFSTTGPSAGDGAKPPAT